MRHPKMVLDEQNKLSYLNKICIRSLKDLRSEVSERDRLRPCVRIFHSRECQGLSDSATLMDTTHVGGVSSRCLDASPLNTHAVGSLKQP